MKTLKLFLLPVLEIFDFGWLIIRYALIFVSAFFRQRASLGCEMVAMRSQLSFYEESIRQKRQPRPRFHPAFRLLWVLLGRVWSGWKSAADLMKPKTVLKWHQHAFLQWWRWKSRRKGGRPTVSQEMAKLPLQNGRFYASTEFLRSTGASSMKSDRRFLRLVDSDLWQLPIWFDINR